MTGMHYWFADVIRTSFESNLDFLNPVLKLLLENFVFFTLTGVWFCIFECSVESFGKWSWLTIRVGNLPTPWRATGS